ncbi:unnamed protein product [Dicrocoelium dendriticum]|nr:unnamed protein product [Dicrocoelium dendriticum]
MSSADERGIPCPKPAYSPGCLTGNWLEERADWRIALQPKPLPSSVDYRFQSEYMVRFGSGDRTGANSDAVVPTHAGTSITAFPGHQPQLCVPDKRTSKASELFDRRD